MFSELTFSIDGLSGINSLIFLLCLVSARALVLGGVGGAGDGGTGGGRGGG